MRKRYFERRTVDSAIRLVDRCLYGEAPLSALDAFLCRLIDPRYQQAVEDEGARAVRTEQNLFMQLVLHVLDNHPLSVRTADTLDLRRLVWRHAGIRCDDWERLEIRAGVRFDSPTGGNLAYFNPANLFFLTGGQRVIMTGLRRPTYIDGSGQVIVYGGLVCASGVNIFTHDHAVRDTERPLGLAHGGVVRSNTILYPDVFVGEDAFVFGRLDLRTMVLAKSVTRLKVRHPPYTMQGGVGAQFGVKEEMPVPRQFPPSYLLEMATQVKAFSPSHGAHLENYLVLVGEYLAGGQKDWPDYLAEIRKLEARLLGEGD